MRSHFIDNWEATDEPEHLKTIRDRILSNEQRAAYLLELYQQVWQQGEIVANNSFEEGKLQLSGLVVKHRLGTSPVLKVYNPIYREVFNQDWINQELAHLRPYSEAFRAWVASDCQDQSLLLRGQTLKNAQAWAKGKNLSYQDQQFLAASEKKQIEEQIAQKERDAELERERKDREAAQTINLILTEANRKAKRRINIGAVVIILAVLGAIISGLVASKEVIIAQQAKEDTKQAQKSQKEAETIANKEKIKAQQAQKYLVAAKGDIKKLERQQIHKSEELNQAKKELVLLSQQQKQAEINAIAAEDRALKATQVIQQAQKDLALAKSEIENLEQQQIQKHEKLNQANQELFYLTQKQKQAEINAIDAEKRALKSLTLATTKLDKAQQDAQAANQQVKLAEQRVQQANIERDQAKQEVKNVSQLSELAGELYRANKHSEAERAWKKAALSFEIQDYELKQAMLLSNISIAYQQLERFNQAKNAVSESLEILANSDNINSLYHSVILAQALNAQGRLLAAQGDTQGASSAYAEAFDSLQSLGSDLTSIDSAIQVSFGEIVESVYQGFIGSLLEAKETGYNQQTLKKVRQVIESLHLTELNNFRKIVPLNPNLIQIDQIDFQAAVIYPIILDDRLEVILHLPGQPLQHYSTPLSAEEIEQTLSEMQSLQLSRTFIETRSSSRLSKLSEKVYTWLIKPAETKLAKSSIKTLVFVPNSRLGNIPMAALHDGEQYLVEKYAIAVTPALQILEPQPQKQKPLKALIAGLSESRQGYPPLPFVEVELEKISSIIPSSVLLNQDFTGKALENALNSSSFPVVHLATNGEFSSEDTFILAWDKKITAKEFEKLLGSREQEKFDPIELLVLSACESAQGNNQRPFGFAGLALRSRVRSILGALWPISDQPTVELMGQFYQEFTQQNVTKAEALRRAQLSLLEDHNYKHPYLWAPFVIIGDWR
ncbi:MAG: CHAT domain-containing protein [Moorea sp. SIO2I5]|nr:CHAT domain-containing protein [Moorena sp. SIO2I5]